jgi:hypothetical protein
MQYLSVADSAREADFIHVSASGERQEWPSKTGAITKTKEERMLTRSDASGHSGLCFYTVMKVK